MSNAPSPSSSESPPQIPPAALLYQLAIGHYGSRAVHLAAKLRLADHLADGPLDAQQLAKATGTHAPSLHRLLRLLTTVGVLEELEGGRFAPTPLGEMLREDVPGSARALVMFFAGRFEQDGWRDLEWSVQTGRPAHERTSPGLDWAAAIASDPEAVEFFDRAMATFAPHTAAAVAAAYDFSRFETLVDVGGGNGALLLGILRANPALRGVIFDQPHVAAHANACVRAAGLADRCAVVGGSFFEALPPSGDGYLLKHVIHDWDDDRAIAILRNVRAATPPHGKVLVVEGLSPARADTSPAGRGAAANDVNMLVATGGRQRSEAEFRKLYATSGFRLTRIVPTPSPAASLIEGAPV
jgi:hypothetical protein